MKILAIVTDAFGGYGGIAQYNRDLLSAFAALPQVDSVIAIPRLADPSQTVVLPKLVQLIKLTQEIVGHGEWRSRPPRLALTDSERKTAQAIVRTALDTRPIRATRVG